MGNIIYGIGTGEGSLAQYQTESFTNCFIRKNIPIQRNINQTLRKLSDQEVEGIKTDFNWSTKYFWKAAT